MAPPPLWRALKSEEGPGTGSGGLEALPSSPPFRLWRLRLGPRGRHALAPQDSDALLWLQQGAVTCIVEDEPCPLRVGEGLWLVSGVAVDCQAGPAGAQLLGLGSPAAAGGEDAEAARRIQDHHAAMLQRLDQLTAALGRDAAAGAELLAYWRTEVLPHAAAEEGTLYSAASAIPGAAIWLQALRAQHGLLRQRVAELAATLALASAGTQGAAVTAAAAAALLRAHAEMENTVLLPALQAAGPGLGPLLQAMERTFASARAGH